MKIWPTTAVAGKTIDTGAEARSFAQYMNIHALEASGGLTYAQMPRYATADGKGTNDPTKAVQVNGQPQDNAARNLWVTETALSGALNMSYMAEQMSLFGIIVGVALLLSGIGFAILALGGTLRGVEPALKLFGSNPKNVTPPASPRISRKPPFGRPSLGPQRRWRAPRGRSRTPSNGRR